MLNPYNFFQADSSGTYHFVTDQNVTYSIYFTDFTDWFGVSGTRSRIVMLGFEIIDKPKGTNVDRDPRIGQTIIQFMGDFIYRNNQDVLIYFSSTSDKKHKARDRKFNGWYSYYKQYFPELSRSEIYPDGQKSYLIYWRDNALAKLLIEQLSVK